jgi:hypothetical protein
MTTLVLDELRTTLEQNFTTVEREQVYAIRPNLYLHNDPVGTFILSIKQGSTTLGSTTLTLAEIKTGAGFADNQYHHGVFRFLFSTPVVLQARTEYTIELSSSGYTFSESSFIGWVKEFENLKNTFTDSISNDYENPFSFEKFSYKGY